MSDQIPATPDNGSDFYNTPLAASTPVINMDTDDPGSIKQDEPGTMISGLNLVHNYSDQPQVTQPTAPVEDVQIKNEPDETEQEDADEAKIEPRDATHIKTEEAMDVDIQSTETATGPAAQTQEEEEQPEWEIDSSPYESSDSDTSTDSDDSEDEDYPILSPEEQARILMQAEAGSEDEGEGKGTSGGFIRSANEIADEVLSIPDVKITPDKNIVLLGKIQTVVDNALLIEANTSGEYQVLEAGSLLCLEDRSIVGVVAETLGRVESPLYTVMFSTAAEVQEKNLVKGTNVYYVESHSTFVFTQPLKGMKGSDASNFHDEEVGEDEVEFSDDEAEAEYKRKLKQKRQERKEARAGGPARSKKGPLGPSKLSYTELNYDDEGGEDGYTPLARPKNLHEMMGAREPPVEGNGRGTGFRGGRGRGRGGRGRGRGGRGGSWERDQDRGPPHYQGTSAPLGASADPQSQPFGYGQPAYQQHQQPVYPMTQPFAAYAQYSQQQQAQQPQFAQGSAPTQFPFQFPFQSTFQQPRQPNPLQAIPPGAHINPLFLAALQQQQPQQPPQAPSQPQAENQSTNFDQVKAQLDLLRNLSNGNQGPAS